MEERKRQNGGFERRRRDAHIGAAKPMADFLSRGFPKNRPQAVEELFTLACIKTGYNPVLVGPKSASPI
jgi:hypothetical protein